MNRLVKLFLVLGLTGLVLAGVEAGPRRGVAPPNSAPTSPRVTEYRTYCGGWSVSLSPQSAAPVEPDPRPLVWVVDGAGDLKGCSTALSSANMLAGNPLELSVFPWSHGYRRLLLDQIDWQHAKTQGERLAVAIQSRKEREPGRRVVLVGHSAGCAVVLAAGDALPPDAIDRTVLLAPSVSTGYDLRPSLSAAKEGLDVFCSRKDWVALGFVIRVVGTTDAGSGTAAGRFGFRPKGEVASDPAVSAKLRQHFWSAEQAWTGHTGGHHGMHSPAFVHAYLFPLFGAPAR
jgi:pimeloyl-ACP methyl ester carboxylesterase